MGKITPKQNPHKLEYFFVDYDKQNPIIILLFMVLSFGFYFVKWIYDTNKKLEEIDDEVPDSNRAAIIMLIMPLTWLGIITILKNVVTENLKMLIITFEILGWSFIIFLSLKYTYDFCLSFGNLTRSDGLTWYIFIYPGYLSLILLTINFYYTLPLYLFTFSAIPAMQAVMNKRADEYTRKYQKETFNSKPSGNTGSKEQNF